MLGQKLGLACELTRRMHDGLLAGDAESIDETTGRLQTLAAECRLLADELKRGSATRGEDADWPNAHLAFEQVAIEMARQSAIQGGLLHGLVGLTRRLLDTFAAVRGDAYSRDGRTMETPFEGLRLKELA